MYVALEENGMCETNRVYEHWLMSQTDNVKCTETVFKCFTHSEDDLEETMNCCGEKVDLLFIYRNCHQSHCLQKLFRLCNTSSSAPLLKLVSQEHVDGQHYVKAFKLTTWQTDVDCNCTDDDNICYRSYWRRNDTLFLPKFVLGMYKSTTAEGVPGVCIDSSVPTKVQGA